MAKTSSDRKTLEEQLRAEIALQKKRTAEAFRANVRIYELTEKIRAAYSSTRLVLECQTWDDLLENVHRVLTDPAGLDYASALIYLVEGDWLVPHSGAGADNKRRIHLQRGNPLARFVRGESGAAEIAGTDGKTVVLLKGRNQPLGLLEVTSHTRNRLGVWQDNLLLTFASTISLMMDNIGLYERLRQESVHDSLTGIYNRRMFDERLNLEVGRAQRYGRELSLVMIDIDDFKPVNDTYGHLAGDRVLVEVARMLKNWSRSIDIVCRFGGEEFSLLLPETSLRNAYIKTERLRLQLEEKRFSVPGAEDTFHVTISAGLSAVTESVNTPELLLKTADEALYRSKKEGKNRSSLPKKLQ